MAEKLRQKAEKIINDLFPDFAINENNYYGKAKFCKTLVEFANEATKELQEQIEKMKNCKNCANYMISGKCPSFFRTGWCKNWEMTRSKI